MSPPCASSVGAPPATGMTYSESDRANATCCPSGDHGPGSRTSPARGTITFGAPPSAGTISMPRAERNRIRLPSGDQYGRRCAPARSARERDRTAAVGLAHVDPRVGQWSGRVGDELTVGRDGGVDLEPGLHGERAPGAEANHLLGSAGDHERRERRGCGERDADAPNERPRRARAHCRHHWSGSRRRFARFPHSLELRQQLGGALPPVGGPRREALRDDLGEQGRDPRPERLEGRRRLCDLGGEHGLRRRAGERMRRRSASRTPSRRPRRCPPGGRACGSAAACSGAM